MSGHRLPMHADEVEVDDDMVRSLLAAQCPAWAGRALSRVPDSGTDNAIYRLGDELGVRLPRIHWAVDQVEKEWRWLGRLAPYLPAPVPVPLLKGDPGHGYPYPWLVYPWVNGTSLDKGTVGSLDRIVLDVAAFVVALREAPVDGGPPPRRRGGPMAPLDREVRWAVGKLDGLVDTGRALRVWEAALEAGPWTEAPVWVHGDLLPGNIVVPRRTPAWRHRLERGGGRRPRLRCHARVVPSPRRPWHLPGSGRIRRRDVGPCSGLGGGADNPLHPLLHLHTARRSRPGEATAASRHRGLSETGTRRALCASGPATSLLAS